MVTDYRGGKPWTRMATVSSVSALFRSRTIKSASFDRECTWAIAVLRLALVPSIASSLRAALMCKPVALTWHSLEAGERQGCSGTLGYDPQEPTILVVLVYLLHALDVEAFFAQ
jgi:hypothetical protein